MSVNKNDKSYVANNVKSSADNVTLTLTQVSLSQLRKSLKGQVISPEDPEYDQARRLFYGGMDRRPGVIIRAANTTDIAQVINLARESGVELAVRSGGHSVAGHSVTEGGILLDLKEMRGLNIDVGSRTAWAETGLTTGEYTAAADAHGLGTGFGDTGSVGIGGITLGGGVGYLVRKYGLAIDNLLAAEIMTADSELLRADSENYPDLFWAIRGGGGNFGVATRFKFRLQDVSPMVGGMLILPATPDSIASFIAEAESAPEELSTIANIMPAPPMPFLPPEQNGKLIIMAMMAYVGDVEAGQRVIAPFRAITKPVVDMVRPIRYPEMFPPEDASYRPTAVSRNMFINTCDLGVAKTILDFLQASDAPLRVAQLRVLGGAMSRVPVNATAFAHRQEKIMVNLAAFYTGPADKPAREAWVSDFETALQQDDTGVYANFMGEEGRTRLHNAYPGATWDRLVAVKTRYDPTNLFHLNHNIPPES